MRHVTLGIPNEAFTFATLLLHCHHGTILSHGDLQIFSFAAKAEEQEELQKHLVEYNELWLDVCIVRGSWIHTEKKNSCKSNVHNVATYLHVVHRQLNERQNLGKCKIYLNIAVAICF